MTTTATRLQVGRVVKFFGGYGNQDGLGAIVAVHGTPNTAPRVDAGVMRVIRAADCTVDVILFDGRRMMGINECGIDRPGIGFRLVDEVLDSVAHLPAVAAEKEAREACEKASAAAAFERAEAARVITEPPVFYWNGIKDANGEKLQKCWYSSGELRSFPDGTITIYARDYNRFSEKVAACFAVTNDTDTQTDYFSSDTIRVIPAHPLYGAISAAMAKQNARRAA